MSGAGRRGRGGESLRISYESPLSNLLRCLFLLSSTLVHHHSPTERTPYSNEFFKIYIYICTRLAALVEWIPNGVKYIFLSYYTIYFDLPWMGYSKKYSLMP